MDIAYARAARSRPILTAIMSGRFEGWPSYVLAVMLAPLAFNSFLWMEPIVASRISFILVEFAVLTTSLTGGLRAGFLTFLLSATLALKLAPFHENLEESLSRVSTYAVSAAMVIILGELMRRSQRSAILIQNQLYWREEQIRSMLQTAPDAATVIDETGRIISINAAAEFQFGYAAAEVLNKNVSMLMPEPDRSKHDDYIQHYLRTGEKRIIGKGRIVTAQRKDGSTFPVLLSIGEFSAGDKLYFTGFMHDLTDRLKAETEVQELHDEVARLSRLNELGEMASTLAHELNQPLSVISNYVQGSLRLLANVPGKPAEAAREALRETTSQTLRAGQIIHHLREAATHGATRMTREHLRPVFDEALQLALVGARPRRIQTRTSWLIEDDSVFIDRVQIQQVLINLIRNAVEAMADAPRRHLSLSVRPDGVGQLRVEIADTGPGVSDDMAQQLFRPFVSGKPGGMGIGLSIAKRIIEAHDGIIGAQRNAGGGATFFFTLPLTEDFEGEPNGKGHR
jgi:two-component system sensor kinase FixL